ncbi:MULTISPECIES: helix-turn-helix domain-containing protein [unclassified Tenacibaculum]|uniref:helix-turn-helix domain-containing protein n=1 Tax=unclassified Tenacibaculum TaxID=2635139 RepID=UPI001F2247F4|nr:MULTISPECIES: helix-turn-helix transcriptional regulator [unclassified Tenacibaculum]MCF2875405.1 helix-turn-helix domain-containing protein [Tenacibaculum sp. Cn5-1]MCF2935481.1 helix-turn-helix domain-containing protein [Tenacibaculum sp. Cn5-34]MCG7512041.1 helix-turn-helix domain-containing protein [Tenacibaculum sp. Cn5-46]
MEKNKLNSEDIKQLRKELGLNQTQLAEKLGVSMRTVQNWEGEQRNIPDWVSNSIRNLGVNDNSSKLILEKEGVKINIEELVTFIVNNEEAFMNEKAFTNIIEIKVAKKIAEITASKNTLLDYLKS